MDFTAKNIAGSILYFVGMMMIILPIIAFFATGGMIVLAGPVFLSVPLLGIFPAVIGKKMINEAKKLDDEKRANEQLRRAPNATTSTHNKSSQ